MAITIKQIQTITEPLAIRSSSDISTFNEKAERNLTELRQMTLDLNNDFIPSVNEISATLDPIVQNLTAVITTSQNIAAITAVNARLTQITTVSDNITDVRTVATDIATVRTVGGSIAMINDVAANMSSISEVILNLAAINAAPESAQIAQQSATEAQQSAQASAISATQSSTSASAAGESETTAQSVETNVISIQQDIRQMHDTLLLGATPDAVPGTPIMRDLDAQAKVLTPTDDLHIANRLFVLQSIAAAIASMTGGLKTPEMIPLESNLPDASTVPDGTFFIIEDLDISNPGYQGRAWKNESVSATEWIILADRMQAPDGTNIILDANGFLNLSNALLSAIAKVDTSGSVQAAINAGLWQNASRYQGTANPATALGVNGDIYFLYV